MCSSDLYKNEGIPVAARRPIHAPPAGLLAPERHRPAGTGTSPRAPGACCASLWGYPVRLVEIDADSERTVHEYDGTEPRDPFCRAILAAKRPCERRAVAAIAPYGRRLD